MYTRGKSSLWWDQRNSHLFSIILNKLSVPVVGEQKLPKRGDPVLRDWSLITGRGGLQTGGGGAHEV